MSADPVTTPDPDREMGFRTLAFLANIVLLLVLATYFFGPAALLIAALFGTFVMLGVVIYLSAPTHRV
jgi:predicted RND superfamily exporter protein